MASWNTEQSWDAAVDQLLEKKNYEKTSITTNTARILEAVANLGNSNHQSVLSLKAGYTTRLDNLSQRLTSVNASIATLTARKYANLSEAERAAVDAIGQMQNAVCFRRIMVSERDVVEVNDAFSTALSSLVDPTEAMKFSLFRQVMNQSLSE